MAQKDTVIRTPRTQRSGSSRRRNRSANPNPRRNAPESTPATIKMSSAMNHAVQSNNMGGGQKILMANLLTPSHGLSQEAFSEKFGYAIVDFDEILVPAGGISNHFTVAMENGEFIENSTSYEQKDGSLRTYLYKTAEGDVVLDGVKEHLFLSPAQRPAGVTWGWLREFYDSHNRGWFDVVDLGCVTISGLIRVTAMDEDGNEFSYLAGIVPPAPALTSLAQITNAEQEEAQVAETKVETDEEDPY